MVRSKSVQVGGEVLREKNGRSITSLLAGWGCLRRKIPGLFTRSEKSTLRKL